MEQFSHISDEKLGKKVRLSLEAHLEKCMKMKPYWEKEGQENRDVRETLRITQKEISENIGACVAVISHFEHGKYVRSRNLVKHAYDMAMKKIQNDRNSILEGEN